MSGILDDPRCQPGAYVVIADEDIKKKTLYRVSEIEHTPGGSIRVWMEDAHSEWHAQSRSWHHTQRFFSPSVICERYTLIKAAPVREKVAA